MSFDAKLERMCISADSYGRKELNRHLKQLAKLVSLVLKEEKWDQLPIKTQGHIEEASDFVFAASELCDAAEYVNEKVIKPNNGRILDVKIGSDIIRAQSQIDELFESGEAPNRGFVYVAWSARPERFLYVGKASSSGRLNLTQHGTLSNAIAHASTLSLVFPAQSREETIKSLEASIIRLAQFSAPDGLEFNKKNESIPSGSAAESINKLASFLNSIAQRVSR